MKTITIIPIIIGAGLVTVFEHYFKVTSPIVYYAIGASVMTVVWILDSSRVGGRQCLHLIIYYVRSVASAHCQEENITEK